MAQIGNFNPNAGLYRSCCCHVKNLTIANGVMEIFIICFVLIAVVPEMSSKICGRVDGRSDSNVTLTTLIPFINDSLLASTSTRQDTTTTQTTTTLPLNSTQDSFNNTQMNITYTNEDAILSLPFLLCQCDVYWLVYAVFHIIFVNVMIYACKVQKYRFAIPHLFLKFLMFLAVIAMITYSFISIWKQDPTKMMYAKGYDTYLIIFFSVFNLYWLFSIIVEIRCIMFLKKSFETGFSTTQTENMRNHTTSNSDNLRLQAANIPHIHPVRPATSPGYMPHDQLQDRRQSTNLNRHLGGLNLRPNTHQTSMPLAPLRHGYSLNPTWSNVESK